MSAPRSRRSQPRVERLDPLVSTSAVPAASAILPTHGLVDLRTTQVMNDIRDDLLRTTPHDGRQGWSLNLIEAAPATRTVYGSVTLLYRAKPLGGFFSSSSSSSSSSSYPSRVKLKVDIAFATNLDDPKARDVKVSVSRHLPEFGPNVRDTMALGVIAFIRQDHDLIAAALDQAGGS